MKTITYKNNYFDVSDEAYAFIIDTISNSNNYSYIKEEINGFTILDFNIKSECEIISLCVGTYSGFLFERFEYLKYDSLYQLFYNKINHNGLIAKDLLDSKQYEPAIIILMDIMRTAIYMDASFNLEYTF